MRFNIFLFQVITNNSQMTLTLRHFTTTLETKLYETF